MLWVSARAFHSLFFVTAYREERIFFSQYALFIAHHSSKLLEARRLPTLHTFQLARETDQNQLPTLRTKRVIFHFPSSYHSLHTGHNGVKELLFTLSLETSQNCAIINLQYRAPSDSPQKYGVFQQVGLLWPSQRDVTKFTQKNSLSSDC